MRIIAGKVKGFIIKTPKKLATRPATELVRGAIFSILENVTQQWGNVLDLFSGSGSLGLEALSRGASWVDFVEQERSCCGIIKQNLDKTGFSQQAHVYCCSVRKALTFLEKEYDIILMDPPYRDKAIGSFIEQLAASRLISSSTTLVTTHSSHLKLKEDYAVLRLLKEHCHGDSIIAVYQKEEDS